MINHPTPNYDILPVIYDHDMTIMRPDPNAECINMQSEVGVAVTLYSMIIYCVRVLVVEKKKINKKKK